MYRNKHRQCHEFLCSQAPNPNRNQTYNFFNTTAIPNPLVPVTANDLLCGTTKNFSLVTVPKFPLTDEHMCQPYCRRQAGESGDIAAKPATSSSALWPTRWHNDGVATSLSHCYRAAWLVISSTTSRAAWRWHGNITVTLSSRRPARHRLNDQPGGMTIARQHHCRTVIVPPGSSLAQWWAGRNDDGTATSLSHCHHAAWLVIGSTTSRAAWR